MAATRDLQYCKTDLIASKGIVFCKYTKASSALLALEEVSETGMVRGLAVCLGSCPPLVIAHTLTCRGCIKSLTLHMLQLAGYKVKCMLAEPKSKGHRELPPPAELHPAQLYQVWAKVLSVGAVACWLVE